MDREAKEYKMSQPKLIATSDYSKFELCQFNRNVERTKSLEESMKKHGYIPAYPIHAVKVPSGKLQIKAGHHRFEVAQKLGLPVYYITCSDEATVHELERATVSWSIKDFLYSFVRCGMEAYREVAEYHEATQIPIATCASILGGESAGSSNKIRQFKTGMFQVTDAGRSHGNDIARIIEVCRRLNPKASDAIFVQSISRCLRIPEFDCDTFIGRVENNPHLLVPCKTIAQMTDVIEAIYNAKARAENRLPVAFLADRAMRERSPTMKKSLRS